MSESREVTADASLREVTADASLREVVAALQDLPMVRGVWFDDSSSRYRVDFGGGVVATVARDLKIDADEEETWLAIYGDASGEIQEAVFEAFAGSLEGRVSMFAPNSADVTREKV